VSPVIINKQKTKQTPMAIGKETEKGQQVGQVVLFCAESVPPDSCRNKEAKVNK
jgi:hypothetical protein